MVFIEEEYIVVGLVSARCKRFQFDGGARGGSRLRGHRCRDVECREKGRKDLGHDISDPNRKMEEERRGLVELLGSGHDLCGSRTTSGKVHKSVVKFLMQ